MQRRFSAQELQKLRNFIPIVFIILEILMIPSKVSEGYFRFLCPLCSEFTTAISQENNLARCFRCQKQFNPIELVMACKKTDFVESVKFLQKYQNISFPKNYWPKSTGNTNYGLHCEHTYTLQTTVHQHSSYSDPSQNNTCNELEPLSEILRKFCFIPNSRMCAKSIQDQ